MSIAHSILTGPPPPRQQPLNNDLRIICAMAKKIDEAEVKKECPSCGLGVALEATICEFCGWDFEEEDEWILQIEKLERELMLEKQKFEPGSVEGKIESTLHTPTIERTETRKGAAKTAEQPKPAPKTPPPAPAREPGVMREARPSEVKAPKVSPAPAVGRPAVIRAEPVPEAEPSAGARMRKVRTVTAAPGVMQEQPAAGEAPKKTRLVRKVKQ